MTASWMGWGPFCKVPNIHRCTAQSSVPSSHLHVSSHNFNFILALTLITMIIITMIHTVTCHVSLGKYSPCHWANTGRVYEKVEFVSGVDQENVLLAVCSPGLNPIGESCSYQSHHRHHAGYPSDCGKWVECYTTAALFSGSVIILSWMK